MSKRGCYIKVSRGAVRSCQVLQALCARPCHRPLHRIDFARLVLSCFKRTIKRLWERKRQVTSLATLHRIRLIHVRGHRYIEVLSAAEAVQRCVKDDDLWIGIRRRARATMQQRVPLSLSYDGSQHRGVCPTVVRLADSVPDRTRSQHFRGRSIVH